MSTKQQPPNESEDVSELSDDELLERIAETDTPLAELAETALDEFQDEADERQEDSL